jgi:hypothetical protein
MAHGVRPSRTGGYSALLIYIAFGVVGGIAAGAYAALALEWPATLESATDPFLSAVPWLSGAAATVCGVLGGWFVAALLVSRAPGRLRCPRCGTANDPGTRSCGACGLSFV